MAIVDYFLKMDGVEGESTDSKHKGWIEVESWSWSEAQMGTHSSGGGGGAGKVKMRDLAIVSKTDKSSPKLFQACATGQHIKTGTLSCRKAGGTQQEYLKITLSDVLVSSWSHSADSTGGALPTDQFSINFAKIEFEYKEQKADGSTGGTVKAGWDVAKNKKT
jgi:type VI secretion system secreted protein Hcp